MRIEELRRLEQAATPGPWSEFCESGDWWVARKDAEGGPLESVCDSNTNIWADQDDIELMIAARNALPALLRVAEAAREVCNDYAPTEGPQTPAFALLRAALAALEAAR